MSELVPEYLMSTYRMLKCAFPEGIAPEDYSSILAILHEKMSYRNVAEVVSVLTDQDYIVVLNDAYKSESTDAPAKELISKVKHHLKSCGYQDWLQEE